MLTDFVVFSSCVMGIIDFRLLPIIWVFSFRNRFICFEFTIFEIKMSFCTLQRKVLLFTMFALPETWSIRDFRVQYMHL
jgi:hypothetical protein